VSDIGSDDYWQRFELLLIEAQKKAENGHTSRVKDVDEGLIDSFQDIRHWINYDGDESWYEKGSNKKVVDKLNKELVDKLRGESDAI